MDGLACSAQVGLRQAPSLLRSWIWFVRCSPDTKVQTGPEGRHMWTPLSSSVGMGVPGTSSCHAVDLAGVEDASENLMFTACSWGEMQPLPGQTSGGASASSHAREQVPS